MQQWFSSQSLDIPWRDRAEQSRDDQNQRLSTLQTTRLPESLHTRAKHSETPSFIIVRCWSESCQTHRTPRTVVPVCPLGCRAAVTACVASHNATGSVERQPYCNRSPEAGLLCSSLERLALHTLRVATDCVDTLSRAPPCTYSAECSWHELLATLAAPCRNLELALCSITERRRCLSR